MALPALKSGARVAAIVPQTIEEVFRVATALHKSGMAPASFKNAEALTIAIMHGLEIGLPPMQAVQRIAVINGRPTVWGDAIPALLWGKGFKLDERMDGENGTERAAVCRVTRPDGAIIERRFSVADAMQAGLWGKQGPWKQYPDRMLAMRARAFACRDGAADALAGLYISEELQDVQDLKDITPRKSSAAGKRDGTDKTFNEIMCQVEEAPSVAQLYRVRDDLYKDEWAEMPSRWADLLNEAFVVRENYLKQAAAE